MENPLGVPGASPPLHPTEVIHQLQNTDGQILRPEIFGKIDKGFFMADSDWTCYRRNYFSLNCSYTLHPAIPSGPIHLLQHGASSPQVYGFALSIAAVVDGPDGKAIELVQHTPKRDKGPQEKPSRITLSPRPPPSQGMYGGDSGLGSGSRGLYDQSYGQNPNQPATEATFERIQFKNATANNGKRRAAQQYYHLLVELFADLGTHHPDRYIKIASRISAPMVVRGRSPGHYQNERRGSNASTGPGGSGGAGGGGSYTPSGSTSRTPGEMGMPGTSMLPSSGYGPSSYDARSHQHQHYRPNIASLSIPMEPTLSAEEADDITKKDCYVYYPAPIWEGHEARYPRPSVSTDFATGKIKQEYNSSGFVLPSLTSTQDHLGMHCGRWEGTTGSKGYFPSAVIQQELNMS
jgi:meiosis-specific transcription factor NDT80